MIIRRILGLIILLTALAILGGSIYAAASGVLVSIPYNIYYAGSAIGIDASSAYGDVAVSNASDITALGLYVDATGISAVGPLDTVVTNSGDIDAASLYAYATGISASGAYVVVSNSGAIIAESDSTAATGILANATHDATVTTSITSDIAVSGDGIVRGIRARSQNGDVTISNAGDISVIGSSYFFDATGIHGDAPNGDVSISSSGDISAYSIGFARGIFANGVSASIVNGGSVDATSAQWIAYGLYANGSSVSVVNNGDIHAYAVDTGVAAVGLVARAGAGDSVVQNAGQIHADSTDSAGGSAFGVNATSYSGDVFVSNSGSISVSGASYGVGVSMNATSGMARLNNSGVIRVDALWHIDRDADDPFALGLLQQTRDCWLRQPELLGDGWLFDIPLIVHSRYPHDEP